MPRGEVRDCEAQAENPMKGFVRGMAQYMLQVSIEEEVTEFLGRGRYSRGARLRAELRNGYESKGIQSEVGLMEVEVPQLRRTKERYRSKAVERLGRRTEDLDHPTPRLTRGRDQRGACVLCKRRDGTEPSGSAGCWTSGLPIQPEATSLRLGLRLRPSFRCLRYCLGAVGNEWKVIQNIILPHVGREDSRRVQRRLLPGFGTNEGPWAGC